MLVRAAGELEIGGGLVTDFEAFEFDDADILRAALPDLALLEFERHGILKSLSLPPSEPGETDEDYFFFDLAAGFFFAALLTFALTFAFALAITVFFQGLQNCGMSVSPQA